MGHPRKCSCFVLNIPDPCHDVKHGSSGHNFPHPVRPLATPPDYSQSPSGSRNQQPIPAFKTTGQTRRPFSPLIMQIMLTPEFLRRQAENCLRIARSCFDLASAERLRLMAAELNAKAAEMDEQTRQDRWSHSIERNPSS